MCDTVIERRWKFLPYFTFQLGSVFFYYCSTCTLSTEIKQRRLPFQRQIENRFCNNKQQLYDFWEKKMKKKNDNEKQRKWDDDEKKNELKGMKR